MSWFANRRVRLEVVGKCVCDLRGEQTAEPLNWPSDVRLGSSSFVFREASKRHQVPDVFRQQNDTPHNFRAHAVSEWVDWFNHRRLLELIGNVPPAELETSYYHSMSQLPMAA
jgi:transposase InsO family protein